MAFEDFLEHTCDIYHMIRQERSPGYSLPASPAFYYPDVPDASGVICHFGVKGRRMNLTQQTPQTQYEATIKLTLPLHTDIRLNDKVVDLSTGYAYTADIPQVIRAHHVIVFLQRRNVKGGL